MDKRGQATLFIILGIVLVILVILYFVLVQQNIIPPLLASNDASAQMSEVSTHVQDCLQTVGNQYATQIAAQGGYLAPSTDTYRLYNDTSVSYLCWNQVGLSTCTNRLLTVQHMEEDLTQAIEDSLQTCINVYDVSDDVEAADQWDLTVDIQRDSIDLSLYYPVTVDDGDNVVTQDTFSESLNVPLGELYDVSQDIVNDHAVLGEFEQLTYMLSKLSRYTIYKYRPYPDVLYQVRLREGTYVFQFAIQGEENV
ncbi:hypothetical protein EXS74_04040 [Candidatus Woesearchaeota archaeon]|nr:hypothetical protein [Candidatus Woesearchaeota archaeon]